MEARINHDALHDMPHWKKVSHQEWRELLARLQKLELRIKAWESHKEKKGL